LTEAVVVGTSAGGIDALSTILAPLPPDYLPVMIVIHIPPDRNNILAELFQAKCRMKVKEAEDKEPIEPGTIYFAPPNYHLLVEPDRRLSLSSDEPVLFSRPSIDVLFESASDAYGESLLGAILTGASPDGSLGLRAVVDAGGVGVVQLPESAQASTMPQAALDLCPEAKAMDLAEISAHLLEIAEVGRR
jgi:two-component system, chemotaxis family, protein-glutamate methylesterase/glutaminase